MECKDRAANLAEPKFSPYQPRPINKLGQCRRKLYYPSPKGFLHYAEALLENQANGNQRSRIGQKQTEERPKRAFLKRTKVSSLKIPF
jgi:hypothetical protein